VVTKKTPAQQFERFVNRDGPVNPKTGTPCHLWTGEVNSDGYGVFDLGRVTLLAHRFAYQLAHGLIATGYFVDHDDPDRGCGVRLCVNVQHLRVMTPFRTESGGR
jgi:hypothetical protein